MIEVLKEPGAHNVGGHFWKDAPLFLLPPAAIVVVLSFSSVAASERCIT